MAVSDESPAPGRPITGDLVDGWRLALPSEAHIAAMPRQAASGRQQRKRHRRLRRLAITLVSVSVPLMTMARSPVLAAAQSTSTTSPQDIAAAQSVQVTTTTTATSPAQDPALNRLPPPSESIGPAPAQKWDWIYKTDMPDGVRQQLSANYQEESQLLEEARANRWSDLTDVVGDIAGAGAAAYSKPDGSDQVPAGEEISARWSRILQLEDQRQQILQDNGLQEPASSTLLLPLESAKIKNPCQSDPASCFAENGDSALVQDPNSPASSSNANSAGTNSTGSGKQQLGPTDATSTDTATVQNPAQSTEDTTQGGSGQVTGFNQEFKQQWQDLMDKTYGSGPATPGQLAINLSDDGQSTCAADPSCYSGDSSSYDDDPSYEDPDTSAQADDSDDTSDYGGDDGSDGGGDD